MAISGDHVLVLPQWIIILRRLQLLTAIAVIGLMSYSIYYLSFDGDRLMMFTAVATIVITLYIIISTKYAPSIYNYWAVVSLDAFAIIFWLVSFAFLAHEIVQAEAAPNYIIIPSYCTVYDAYGYCIAKRSTTGGRLAKRGYLGTYGDVLSAGSGLGGLEFLLFIITLTFTSIYIYRHRQNTTTSPPDTEANYEHSIATTAVEPKPQRQYANVQPVHQDPIPVQPVYEPQPAQPMTAAGTTGQGFVGAQPAYA